MKYKKLIAGAIVLASATTAISANADENQNTEVKPTTEVTSNTETPTSKAEASLSNSEKDLNKAQENAKEIFEKESASESEYNKAKTEAESAQDSVNKITEELSTSENKLAQDENNKDNLKTALTDAENKVNNLQDTITKTQNALEVSKEKQKNEESKIQPQVDALNEAITNKDNAQNKVDSINKSIKENKNKETSLTKDLKEVSAEKSKAEKSEQTAKESLDRAKEFDSNRAIAIKKAQNIVDSSTLDYNNKVELKEHAQNNYNNAKNELNSAQNDLIKNVEVEVPKDFVEALKNYQNNRTDENLDRVNDSAKAWLAQGKTQEILDSLVNSDNTKVDINNLSNEQLKELSVLMSQFVEDVRTKFGTYKPNTLKVSTEIINLSRNISDTYKSEIRKQTNTDNPSFWDAFNVGHLNGKLTIKENLAKSGFTANNLSATNQENLGYHGYEDFTTMGQLKALVYKEVIGWVFRDENSNWGHALSVAGLLNYRYDSSELTTFFVKDGTYVMVGIDETYLKAQAPSMTLHEIEIPKTDMAAAQNRLSNAIENEKSTKIDLDESIDKVNKAKAKLDSDISILNQEKSVLEKTPKAQEDYNKASSYLTKINSDYENKRNALENIQTELFNLNTELPQAEKILNNTISNYNQAKKEYDKVSDAVEKAKSEVNKIQNSLTEAISNLEKAKLEVEDKRKAIDSNEQEISNLKSKISDLKIKLSEANNNLSKALKIKDEKEKIYLEWKDKADKERAKIQVLKDKVTEATKYLNELKEKENIKIDSSNRYTEEYQNIINNVIKDSNNKSYNFNDKNITASERKNNIPKTSSKGESVILTSIFAFMSLFGLAKAKRKEN